MDPKSFVRLGRASAVHLRALCANQTLTPADAKRLLDRIDQAFDVALAEIPAPDLLLIKGGRP
jgi:hypothetical protein